MSATQVDLPRLCTAWRDCGRYRGPPVPHRFRLAEVARRATFLVAMTGALFLGYAGARQEEPVRVIVVHVDGATAPSLAAFTHRVWLGH
jgi:hypothetical protein